MTLIALIDSSDEFRKELSSTNTGQGAYLTGYKVNTVGAVGRTVYDKLAESLSVKDFGALGDGVTDDTIAIQAAIDAGANLNKTVYLPGGEYMLSAPIAIHAKTVLIGAGVTQSTLKAMNNSNTGVLETYGFSDLTGTDTKYITDAGMTWGFVLKDFSIDGNRQNNFGGVSGTRFGGVGSTVWDGFGIRLYGRRYIIENVNVRYCAGIGFYSECGSPVVSTPADWYYNPLNNQYGHIHGLCISDCSYEGFIFNGPGDIQIDNVTSELCFYPDTTLYGTARASLMFPTQTIDGMVFTTTNANLATGGCEIGFIHSHTHKNGYGIRFFGDTNVPLRIRGDNITSEGNLSGVKLHGRVRGQLNKLNIRNLNFGDGTLPDFDYSNSDTETFSVSEYENIGSTGNAGSIRMLVAGDGLQCGIVLLKGYVPGHGVVFDENVHYCSIQQLRCVSLRGTAYDGNASRAVWTRPGASYNYIGQIISTGCDVGWYNEATGENILKEGLIEIANSSALGVSFVQTPPVTALKRCGFTVRDAGGNTSTFATYSGAASIDPTSTTLQTLTFTHNLWRTPALHEVGLSYTTNGTTRPTLATLEIASVTSTSITARLRFSAAGNGTTTGSALFAKI